jgi:2'-hydroxyisoflavone reductase
MRILVVGGTRFVGRHFVTAALEAGHDVALLHRGSTGADLFPECEHLLADRDGDLSVLAGESFDAAVDVCAYFPRQVRSLADALDGRGGHHVFVSTVDVYEPPIGPNITESAPLRTPAGDDVTEVTDETYGTLKVACEHTAGERYDGGLAIVRPTYVVGPYDLTWRLPWWIQRIAAGGDVLAPGPYDAPIQVIDARDQGVFMTGLVEAGVSGAFHTVSPAPPYGFGDLLEAIAAQVAPPGTDLVWAEPDALHREGVDGDALPMWVGADPDPSGISADPAAAVAAGLAVRPLAQTIDETWAWIRTTGDPPAQIGLAAERESELLDQLRGRAT